MTVTGPPRPSEQTDRRTILAGATSFAAVLLAGCSGDGGTDTDAEATPDDDPDPTETPHQTQTDEPTATPSADSTETPAGSGTDPATLERRAREFLRLQAEGSFETAHERLTDAAAQQLPVTDLETVWQQQILPGAGEFESIVGSEYQKTTDGGAVITVEAVFTNVHNTFQVAVVDEGIQGYQLTAQEGTEWTAPTYADTSAFTETTVALTATDSCELGGTLTVPTGNRAVSGVVIVHGSGPIDRDATFGSNKPYKELAWGLASRGIAVLRYDKRTNACDVDLADVTVDDVTTADAVTAVGRLREHDRVTPESAFVVGHSLGGALAPRIATRDGDLAGVVMLAPGPARPMAATVLSQQRHLLAQRDLSAAEREEALAEFRPTVEKIRSLDIGDDEVLLGLGGREYFRSLAEYDGPAAAAALDSPVFVGQGGRDYQVTPDGDFRIWRETLSGEPRVRFERYPDLNHLFQAGSGPATSTEYYDPEAVFDRRVVEDVAAVVERHA